MDSENNFFRLKKKMVKKTSKFLKKIACLKNKRKEKSKHLNKFGICGGSNVEDKATSGGVKNNF